MSDAGDGLGSLAQSARKGHLKTARGIMFFVGVLTLLINGGLLLGAESMVESEINQEVRKLQAQGMEFDPAELAKLKESAVRETQLVSGAAAGIGVIFCVLGALVYKIPVPATVLALVLYVGAAAVFGMLDPSTLAKGLIVKIIIVVALVKAVNSAIAYEREQREGAELSAAG